MKIHTGFEVNDISGGYQLLTALMTHYKVVKGTNCEHHIKKFIKDCLDAIKLDLSFKSTTTHSLKYLKKSFYEELFCAMAKMAEADEKEFIQNFITDFVMPQLQQQIQNSFDRTPLPETVGFLSGLGHLIPFSNVLVNVTISTIKGTDESKLKYISHVLSLLTAILTLDVHIEKDDLK